MAFAIALYGRYKFCSEVAIERRTCGGGSVRFSVPGNGGRQAGVEEVMSRENYVSHINHNLRSDFVNNLFFFLLFLFRHASMDSARRWS